MWLYRTSNDEKALIILHDYKSSRVGQNAANYLAGFKSYLYTEGYASYEKVSGIKKCD